MGRPYDHDAQPLHFLLERTAASTPASRQICEILDSRIENLEDHQTSCIMIMQHSCISDKARSYVFCWLISYTTFSSVREGLDINKETPWSNETAARFFPSFLTPLGRSLVTYMYPRLSTCTVPWTSFFFSGMGFDYGTVGALRYFYFPCSSR